MKDNGKGTSTRMSPTVAIRLGGTLRAVTVDELGEVRDASGLTVRTVRITFEVPAPDHTQIDRELHRASRHRPLLDESGAAWWVTRVDGVREQGTDTRVFTVHLQGAGPGHAAPRAVE